MSIEVRTIPRRNNTSITIVFDGIHYIFIDSFKGLFAVATRQNGKREDGKETFVLSYGNSHDYSDTDYRQDKEFAETQILSMESKYIEVECKFLLKKENCNEKYYPTLSINEYGK